jgi:hypothetical protein
MFFVVHFLALDNNQHRVIPWFVRCPSFTLILWQAYLYGAYMWRFRFSQRWLRRLTSGMWCCDRHRHFDGKHCIHLLLLYSECRGNMSLETLVTSTRRHGVTSQTTVIFIFVYAVWFLKNYGIIGYNPKHTDGKLKSGSKVSCWLLASESFDRLNFAKYRLYYEFIFIFCLRNFLTQGSSIYVTFRENVLDQCFLIGGLRTVCGPRLAFQRLFQCSHNPRHQG